ncbi:hypothetical protein KR51_00026070 [Rubidibacter lacunae KORDI 51-2]|uniref:DUF1499 domain-containing protein n=1 Tax=Rubidibacter lacunae KORDI 51-2 TaxID=582515 RepID=U5DJY7_9CHRO|nr:DUF1499 domain-containing protein [Rubidibacter lacunae]ERN40894.1 hypothetical protein KR51_00026070 [Rubidibacter lacunae KORDI 51-2]
MFSCLRTLLSGWVVGLLFASALLVGATPPAVAVPTERPAAAPVQLARLFSFSGSQPTNLGVADGRLAPCPPSPNCVSSQSVEEDHRIAPLELPGKPEAAIGRLQSLLEDIDNTKIIETGNRYLYAQFTSRIMGFVDDVEFYVDGDGRVQVRSASRLGESDLGVNRKRIEAIRAALAV